MAKSKQLGSLVEVLVIVGLAKLAKNTESSNLTLVPVAGIFCCTEECQPHDWQIGGHQWACCRKGELKLVMSFGSCESALDAFPMFPLILQQFSFQQRSMVDPKWPGRLSAGVESLNLSLSPVSKIMSTDLDHSQEKRRWKTDVWIVSGFFHARRNRRHEKRPRPLADVALSFQSGFLNTHTFAITKQLFFIKKKSFTCVWFSKHMSHITVQVLCSLGTL